MLTIVINYVCDCTIWGYYPLGIPAVLTAQYIILNLKSKILNSSYIASLTTTRTLDANSTSMGRIRNSTNKYS